MRLFQILVPSWHCSEVSFLLLLLLNVRLGFKVLLLLVFVFQMGFLLLVAMSLIARTFADVFLILNGTTIERFWQHHTTPHTHFSICSYSSQRLLLLLFFQNKVNNKRKSQGFRLPLGAVCDGDAFCKSCFVTCSVCLNHKQFILMSRSTTLDIDDQQSAQVRHRRAQAALPHPTHQALVRQVLAQPHLLQNEQPGQPDSQRRSAAHSGCREILQLTHRSLLKHQQSNKDKTATTQLVVKHMI